MSEIFNENENEKNGTMTQRNIAIVHFNTPELTEACILSLRKHGGENYQVYVLDNSADQIIDGVVVKARPFTKRMKGVKVLNNRKGQIIDTLAELEKYTTKSEKAGCAKGCYFGSDVHMMCVQKLWELIPDGFVLLDSDVLIKQNIDWLWLDDQCCYGYIGKGTGLHIHERLVPMLLWINVPMCVAGGARFFDPDRAWALHEYESRKNWWDTGAAFLDDIRRLKPQCHGKVMNREMIKGAMEHYGGGSWHKNDLEMQQRWLNEHADLWK